MCQNVATFKWLRRWQSNSFVLLVTSIFFVVSICDAQTDRYITVPALGRFCEIGYLYDERSDRIIDSTVFRHKVSSDFITEFQSPTTTTETTTENSFEQLRQMFDISLDTTVNIWTGISKPKGAAIILNPNKRGASVLTGTLLVKQETVAQRLQVFYDGLKESYNPYLLNHLEATHIVTGITWGGRVVVTLKANPSNGNIVDAEIIKDQINDEFLKLERASAITEDEHSNFTISVNADVSLPSQSVLKSMKDVQQFLIEFQQQIKTLNGGKGVPLELRLTPIRLIREFLKAPERHQNVARKVPNAILRKLADIFSNFFNVEERITSIQTILSSQPNCVTPQTAKKIEDLNSNFFESKSALKDALHLTLIQVRSGNQSSATLENLAQTYNHRNHSVRSYQSKFAEFDGALQKIGFCKRIEQEEAGSKIEYFGLSTNLILRISQESDKSVLILFTKTDWAQANAVKFTENLNLILRGFNTSSSSTSRFIVDCDFEQQPFCNNLTDTTVHKYENGILTSTNFKQTVRQEATDVQKQITDLQSATETLQERLTETILQSSNKMLSLENDVKAALNFTFENSQNYAQLKRELEITRKAAKENQLYAGQLNTEVAAVNITVQQNSEKLETLHAGQQQHKESILQNCNKIVGLENDAKASVKFISENSRNITQLETELGSTLEIAKGNQLVAVQLDTALRNVNENVQQHSEKLTQVFQMFEETQLMKNKCSAGNTCLNGGSCVDTNDGFSCACAPGFEGTKCERQANNCAENPCKNSGACQNGVSSFTCICPQGFTGNVCDVSLNECSGSKNPCENGGHCIDEVGGYTCVCPLPFAGQKCQYRMQDPCVSSPCRNGASCVPSLNYADFTCSCDRGFTGTLCEVDIDECSRNVSLCQNSGVCRNTHGSFSCECAAGFEGIHCATNINECDSSSCLNGGTCADKINSFSCTCSNGFRGNRCETIEVSICTATEKASRNQTKVITQSGAGLVEIPEFKSKSSFLLEYKPDASHVDNQKPRVWTINSLNDGKNYRLKCKVTLLCGNPRDIFSVLEWNYGSSGMTLNSTELTKNLDIFVSISNWSYKLFLSYTSADGLSPGFLAFIEIVELEHVSIGSNFVYTNGATPGSITHGPTKRWDKFSVVVNPKETNTTLTLDRLSSVSTTCGQYNTLDIYDIQPGQAPRRLDRLCGSVTSPISHTSQFPFIATFYDYNPSGNTFQLSWE